MMFAKLRPFSRFVRLKYSTFLTELTPNQLREAEEKLKCYLPQSLTVYGYVTYKNKFPSEQPVKVLVDKWPDFNVVVCKEMKEAAFFSINKTALEAIVRDSSFLDLSTCYVETAIDNMEIFNVLAAEKQMSIELIQTCQMGVMNDFSKLLNPNSAIPPGTSLVSVNESHFDLIYEAWTSVETETEQSVRNMMRNFPSCCLLDSRGRPISWLLTHSYGALGMFYTHPDHRGRGYGHLVNSVLIRRLHSEGLPVFVFIDENNERSLKIAPIFGFTVNPLYREVWFKYKHNDPSL